jgi:hypothetical protein
MEISALKLTDFLLPFSVTVLVSLRLYENELELLILTQSP